MKRVTILTIIGIAIMVAIALFVCRRPQTQNVYCAECMFAYWNEPVSTNEVGEVLQPDYWSGSGMESMVRGLREMCNDEFVIGVAEAYRRAHPMTRYAMPDLTNIAASASLVVVGRPIPVLRLSMYAPSAELANGMLDAYFSSIQAKDMSFREGHMSKATQQVSGLLEKLRRQSNDLAGRIASLRERGEVVPDAMLCEKGGIDSQVKGLEDDIRKMLASSDGSFCHVQPLHRYDAVRTKKE